MVDLQNATLSGGVAVGAIADLMIHPYGAFFAGTCVGAVSTVGYRIIQVQFRRINVLVTLFFLLHQPYLYDKLKLHDTCGVNNLHGMPGIISGLLSCVICYLATEDSYGPSLYLLFPRRAPIEGSGELVALNEQLDGQIEAGDGRTASEQALMQLAALVITIVLSLVSGAVTGT